MEKAVDFYSGAAVSRLKRKEKIWAGAFYALVVGALFACVVLCAITNVHHAGRTEIPVIVISGGAGCAAIFFYVFGYGDSKRELKHTITISKGEREFYRGRITSAGALALRLPGSITAKKVSFQSANGETLSLSVNEKNIKKLPINKEIVLSVNCGYVAGYEYENV